MQDYVICRPRSFLKLVQWGFKNDQFKEDFKLSGYSKYLSDESFWSGWKTFFKPFSGFTATHNYVEVSVHIP